MREDGFVKLDAHYLGIVRDCLNEASAKMTTANTYIARASGDMSPQLAKEAQAINRKIQLLNEQIGNILLDPYLVRIS
jgi:hypothetical protein